MTNARINIRASGYLCFTRLTIKPFNCIWGNIWDFYNFLSFWFSKISSCSFRYPKSPIARMMEPYENSRNRLVFTINPSNPAIRKTNMDISVNRMVVLALLGLLQIRFSYFKEVLDESWSAAKLKVKPIIINCKNIEWKKTNYVY